MEKSVTLLFPGQGSQYVGMGKTLGDSSLFQETDQALGYDLSGIMLDGPTEELNLTKNTQPAILSYSMGLFRKLKKYLDKHNIKVDRVLGHSLGEYSALVAAEVLTFEDALKAVHLRGQYMQDAVPLGKGKMFAILKVPADWVYKACERFENVIPANFNGPGQIVISGEARSCEQVVEWLNENYDSPFRAKELKVSAPFHSPLMRPAGLKLKETLNNFPFKENKTPYLANVDANEYLEGTSVEKIKENLVDQVDSSVLWLQSFAKIPDGSICIEVGPGKVLKGLAKKINRNIKVISMDSENFSQELEEILQ
ncbi:MAG: [acyl-carrier-protein] S-malonyltransferase [Epsilonproteobacteria bacterium]|nr:MAG: [acyl-carrier-protein] S-malonyltransferase [Campylobacterota bacterium]RLA65023.1 MAG: [acyl-carrier-protein] S-malonyltransferase [Campylobacterota bacterium]